MHFGSVINILFFIFLLSNVYSYLYVISIYYLNLAYIYQFINFKLLTFKLLIYSQDIMELEE